MEGEKGEGCVSVRESVCLCVWGRGHLAEGSEGGVRVPIAECGVLGSTSKPGMQGPSLSEPTCSTLGTKVGSGFTAPASEVGTLRSGSWRIGENLPAEHGVVGWKEGEKGSFHFPRGFKVFITQLPSELESGQSEPRRQTTRK